LIKKLSGSENSWPPYPSYYGLNEKWVARSLLINILPFLGGL